MRRALGVAIGIVVAILVGSTAARAQGLEFLHEQRVEAGRVCFTDHFHSSSSSGHATRAAAEKDAQAGWSSFTAFEYGNRWGSWRIAASKSMSCSQTSGWGCQVEARPCRPNVGGAAGGARRTRAVAKKK